MIMMNWKNSFDTCKFQLWYLILIPSGVSLLYCDLHLKTTWKEYVDGCVDKVKMDLNIYYAINLLEKYDINNQKLVCSFI